MHRSSQLVTRGAVFLLLLVRARPFTMLLGPLLAFFLQMLGQILSVTTPLLQLVEMLRFILLAQVGMRSFRPCY